MRVGYRVTESAAYELAAGTTDTLHLVLGGEAVRLAAQRPSRRPMSCRGFSASGGEVAAAWDEARKALEASNLAVTDESPLQAEWVQYDRVLASGGTWRALAADPHHVGSHAPRLSQRAAPTGSPARAT